MQISFEKFKESIDRIKRILEFDEKINTACREYQDIIVGEPLDTDGWLIDSIIDLLKILTNDKHHLISYYIFECTFGTEFTIGELVINDKAIDISTVDKLYDFLKEDYNND